jgi:hypothetical protein
MGFGIPMLIGTVDGLIGSVVALFFCPETKSKDMEADPSILRVAKLP